MKVTSALLTSMSGSIGGATASRARGDVQYFRKRITPSNPRTALQTAIRAAVSSAATYWRNTMSESDREAWWDAAQNGQTGGTLFAKINQPRLYANNSGRCCDETGTGGAFLGTVIIAKPPASFSANMTFPGSVVIDDSANTLTLTDFNNTDDVWDGRQNDVPALVYVYASHQQSASRLSRQHPYQLLAVIQVPPAVDPADIAAVINLATLGLTTETGKVMYLKVFASKGGDPADNPSENAGGISTPQERRITITA